MFIHPDIHNLLNEYHMRLTPDEVSKLLDLLRTHNFNDKIAAITMIRQDSGLGLKDAKDLADALEQVMHNS